MCEAATPTDPASEPGAGAVPSVELDACVLAMSATRVLVGWHAGAIDAEEAIATLYRTFARLMDERAGRAAA
jgi:hypothetical protein